MPSFAEGFEAGAFTGRVGIEAEALAGRKSGDRQESIDPSTARDFGKRLTPRKRLNFGRAELFLFSCLPRTPVLGCSYDAPPGLVRFGTAEAVPFHVGVIGDRSAETKSRFLTPLGMTRW